MHSLDTLLPNRKMGAPVPLRILDADYTLSIEDACQRLTQRLYE
jgi:hypothetical protein